jgi:hypothetical protein
MNIQPSLAIGPLKGAKRISALEDAILRLDLPWNCDNVIKEKAKEVAIHSSKNGLIPTVFIKELTPLVFKTQRDAKRAMVKISFVGLAAVRQVDWEYISVTQYEWGWMPMLCDYPAHENRQWKIFNVKDGDLPATKYGCRCMGRAIYD